MTQTYRHTQIGRRSTVVFAVLISYAVLRLALGGFTWPVAILGVTTLALLLLFHSMTIVVTGAELEHYFGVGLLRNRVPVANIDGAEVRRRMPYYGWGLRHTGHGLYWTIAGRDAVEIRLRDGQRFFLGSDEPEELHTAIDRAVHGVRREAHS